MNHNIEGTGKDFYALPGPVTDIGSYASLLETLPNTVVELVPIIQKLVVHIFWAKRYGLELSKERESEVQLRFPKRQLERILELDSRPLNEPRPAERRLIGNCRDYSTLMTALLRAKAIPARARCGFGTYFIPGHYEDHWVVEAWNENENRWVMFDAQLDELQQKVLKLDFNPLDMPWGKFVVAGEAWKMCRRGKANPDDFGIFEYKGWDFIRGNVLRDLLSLNKIEILPWDYWAPMMTPLAQGSPEDFELIDRISDAVAPQTMGFDTVRGLYEENDLLHAPQEWLSPVQTLKQPEAR